MLKKKKKRSRIARCREHPWMDERKGDGMLPFHQGSVNKGAKSPREDAGCELLCVRHRSWEEIKVSVEILAEQASSKCSICSKTFLPLSWSGPPFTYLCDRSFDWSEAAPWAIPEWHYWQGRSHYPARVRWCYHRSRRHVGAALKISIHAVRT